MKPIKCFGESSFFCDRYGSIYNKNGLKLSQQTTKSGYKSITLNHRGVKKTFLVHRLIAVTWLKGSWKEDVNHKNCVKSDNRSCNLEWVTKSENTLHMYKNKRLCKKGEKSSTAKLTNKDVLRIKLELKYKRKSQSQIARDFGVAKQAINNIHKGRSWCHLHLL